MDEPSMSFAAAISISFLCSKCTQAQLDLLTVSTPASQHMAIASNLHLFDMLPSYCMIALSQGCATFLVGGPYNKTSDIKRATLKI